MNRKQSVKSQTFRRVQEFTDQYRPQFAADAPIGQAAAELSAAVDAFDREAATQHTRARAGEERFRVAREALRFKVGAIAQTAEVIAQVTPGFAERFGMPRPNRNAALRAAAEGFLTEAEPLAAQFVAKGLPDTFVADLRAALAEFEAASREREAAKLARASVQVGLRAADRRAVAAIKAINVIVRYQFAHDQQMQSAWKRAKRQDGLPLPKVEANAPTSSPPSLPPTAPPSSPSPSPAGKSQVAANGEDSPPIESKPVIEPAA